MSEFGWKLQPPEDVAEVPPWEEFVSDSVDWEDDYSSQVILGCGYLELCGYTFTAHGFGRPEWPVTVGYDLSTILEDVPNQLSLMERGEPVKIDMYAPGTEVEIDAVHAGDDVVLKCTAARWEPQPGTVVVSRPDFARTIQDMLADFSAALRNVGSPLADVEPFSGWGPGGSMSDPETTAASHHAASLTVRRNFSSITNQSGGLQA